MAVHVYKVHKETITKVPNAKAGKDALNFDVLSLDDPEHIEPAAKKAKLDELTTGLITPGIVPLGMPPFPVMRGIPPGFIPPMGGIPPMGMPPPGFMSMPPMGMPPPNFMPPNPLQHSLSPPFLNPNVSGKFIINWEVTQKLHFPFFFFFMMKNFSSNFCFPVNEGHVPTVMNPPTLPQDAQSGMIFVFYDEDTSMEEKRADLPKYKIQQKEKEQ